MANYIAGEAMNVKFIGDNSTTTLNFDSTNPPFSFPYHSNFAGLYIESYVGSSPAGVFINESGSAEHQVLTFQDSGGTPIPFNWVEVVIRPLYQSL